MVIYRNHKDIVGFVFVGNVVDNGCGSSVGSFFSVYRFVECRLLPCIEDGSRLCILKIYFPYYFYNY